MHLRPAFFLFTSAAPRRCTILATISQNHCIRAEDRFRRQESSRTRNQLVHRLSTNFFAVPLDRARLSTHTLGIIALEERISSERSVRPDEFRNWSSAEE
jgi:hypothetical protein